MGGGKYDTLKDTRGECSAASASSHQQSATERAKGEMIACCNPPCSEEEDSYLKK